MGCKGQKGALSAKDIFEHLESMGRDMSSKETQKYVRNLIKEADFNHSGDIDFGEFLHLMRLLELNDQMKRRQRNHDLITRSGFSDEEIDAFHGYFMSLSLTTEKGQIQKELRNSLDNLGSKMSDKARKQLAEMICETVAGFESNTSCSFGEFVALLGRLVSIDFVKIRERLSKIMQGDNDKISCWRRMIWSKTRLQAKYVAPKDAQQQFETEII